MATPSSVKRLSKETESTKKQTKRFKVGRACFSCRVKKIKCDGIQPCMQCKARQLSCTFSTEGDSPALHQLYDDEKDQLVGSNLNNTVNTQQDLIENAIKTLDNLGNTWCIDEQQLLETSSKDRLFLAMESTLALALDRRLDLPPRKTQKHLINQYYQHKYPLFHMIPQDLFLHQFNQPNMAISPLLLLVIFAHGAQIDSTDDEKEADNYFEQAKGLLESLLGTPSLGMVVSLCLMSLYEPRKSVDYRSPSLYYSAMAFRMYNQLGSYDDDGQLELWKRVGWGCYCLDKLQGICYGLPWMLRLDDMTMDLPRYYWPNEDQEQLECFVAFIKLMQMAEQCLSPTLFFKQHKDYSNALQLDQVLLQWLQALPVHFQWTPTTSITPKASPRTLWIAQLHLVFNMIEQRILAPFASSDQLLHQRCHSVATHLTLLCQFMADQPHSILSYTLTSTAIMMATRVHLMNCGSYQDRSTSKHSQSMVQKGMQSLATLIRHDKRMIPGVDTFLSQVRDAITTGTLLASDDNSTASAINHMYPTGSEQNAAEVLAHAFGTTTPWQREDHHTASVDPLDFLESPAVDDIWNQQRMAPSSVDALMDKSRVLVDDHRQDLTNGGGLVMSHSKLNDPLLLSTWMMQHTKKRQWDTTGPEHSVSDNNPIFWPTTTPPPSTQKTSTTTIPGRSLGQYMNIGLGVYASAHQHHSDVIRQHIPAADGNTSRPVLLTHQGQVIVAPSSNPSTL